MDIYNLIWKHSLSHSLSHTLYFMLTSEKLSSVTTHYFNTSLPTPLNSAIIRTNYINIYLVSHALYGSDWLNRKSNSTFIESRIDPIQGDKVC